MTHRILPPEEWARLRALPHGKSFDVAGPGKAAVIVVEDDDGQIVGHWGVMMFAHAEGIWIAPEHRRSGAVMRRLLHGAASAARMFGSGAVMASTDSAEVADYLTRLGAEPMSPQFMLPLGQLAKE